MVIEQDLMLQTKTLKRDGMDGGGEEVGEGREKEAVFSSNMVRTPGKLSNR